MLWEVCATLGFTNSPGDFISFFPFFLLRSYYLYDPRSRVSANNTLGIGFY